MEEFQSNLSELQNVPFSIDCSSSTGDPYTRQSTKGHSVLLHGDYAVSDKSLNFATAPLYQQGHLHYHTGHPAEPQQFSSSRYIDKFDQYPMAVDMTNRNVQDHFKTITSVVETTDLSHTRLVNDDRSDSLKQVKIMYSKNPRKNSAVATVQCAKKADKSSLSITDCIEQMNDISKSKNDEITDKRNAKCNEKAEVGDDKVFYSCGGCQQRFYTICKLHSHIRTHNQNGSYYYSDFTRTAYPKFDSCCSSSQTEDPDIGQKFTEHTESVDQKSGICCTTNQIKHNEASHTLSNKKERILHGSHIKLKNEINIPLETHLDLAVERLGFIDKMEDDLDEHETQFKKEKDDYECKGDEATSNMVNHDSDTDEYNPDESMITYKRKKQKISKQNRNESERRKCKIKGRSSRKLKQLKMTFKLKNEERKVKQVSILNKDRKPKGKVKREKVDDKIICKQCNIDFSKKLFLRHHVKARHLDVQHLCHLCSDSFQTNEELIDHRKTEHNRGHHKCELCDKVLSTKRMLEGHYLIHKGMKPFSCSICVPKKDFTRKCQLKAHMDTHSTEKTLQCEFCGKPFNARYLMLSHVKHCGGIKPHKCDFCEMSFVSNHCLQRHRRTHTGEKPFICEVCAFASSSASCLARHMRVHTGEKPFVCQYCKQTFAARGALKKHVRIHTQEKPYKCRFCTKAFTQNWNLKTHERQHTGETPYKCHICGVGYKQNVLLKTHLRTHFAPNTDNSDSPRVMLNQSAAQCQSEIPPTVQNESHVNMQADVKPEGLKVEFAEQQHSNSQFVELHSQPMVPNMLLTSFLHSGYNMS